MGFGSSAETTSAVPGRGSPGSSPHSALPAATDAASPSASIDLPAPPGLTKTASVPARTPGRTKSSPGGGDDSTSCRSR